MNNEENQEQQASEESTVNEAKGEGELNQQHTTNELLIDQSVSGETDPQTNGIDVVFSRFQEGIDRLGQLFTGSQNQMQSEQVKVYIEELSEVYKWVKKQLSQGSSISPPEIEKINQLIHGGLKVIEHLKQINESLKSKNESQESKNRSLLSENNLLNPWKAGYLDA